MEKKPWQPDDWSFLIFPPALAYTCKERSLYRRKDDNLSGTSDVLVYNIRLFRCVRNGQERIVIRAWLFKSCCLLVVSFVIEVYCHIELNYIDLENQLLDLPSCSFEPGLKLPRQRQKDSHSKGNDKSLL